MDSPSTSLSIGNFSSSSSSSENSSDEETTTQRFQMFGMAYYRLQEESRTTTRRAINRNRVAAHQRLMDDYFSENPLYGEEIFRRRFRMSKELFLRIVTDLEQEYIYFTQSSKCQRETGIFTDRLYTN